MHIETKSGKSRRARRIPRDFSSPSAMSLSTRFIVEFLLTDPGQPNAKFEAKMSQENLRFYPDGNYRRAWASLDLLERRPIPTLTYTHQIPINFYLTNIDALTSDFMMQEEEKGIVHLLQPSEQLAANMAKEGFNFVPLSIVSLSLTRDNVDYLAPIYSRFHRHTMSQLEPGRQ